MSAPDLRAAVRHGAAHLERMAAELERLEHGGHAAGTDTRTSSTASTILGGYTLDQRVDEALSGPRVRPRRVAPAADGALGRRSRRAPPSPGSSSRTRTCSCSTSPRTTSTSARSSGSRSTSGAAPGALLVASHDRAFLDATVARVWELRDRRLTVFRGDYSALPPPARGAGRSAPRRRPRPRPTQIEREVELVQRYRSQRKHTKMHEHEARLERLREEKIEAPAEDVPITPPPRCGRWPAARSVPASWSIRLEDLAVGYLPGPRRARSRTAPTRPSP